MSLDFKIDEDAGIISLEGPIHDPKAKRRINKVFTFIPQVKLYQAGINPETIVLLKSLGISDKQKRKLDSLMGTGQEEPFEETDGVPFDSGEIFDEYDYEPEEEYLGLGFIVETRAFGLCRLISQDGQTASLKSLEKRNLYKLLVEVARDTRFPKTPLAPIQTGNVFAVLSLLKTTPGPLLTNTRSNSKMADRKKSKRVN